MWERLQCDVVARQQLQAKSLRKSGAGSQRVWNSIWKISLYFFVDIVIFYILFHQHLKILFNPLVSPRSAVTRLPCDADPEGILAWYQALPGRRSRQCRVLICFCRSLRCFRQTNNVTIIKAAEHFLANSSSELSRQRFNHSCEAGRPGANSIDIYRSNKNPITH